jgi:hypothetical protein
MKIFTNSLLFLLASCLFMSCSGIAIVRSEPMYVEIERPRQPNSSYIWIEGDWLWQKEYQNIIKNIDQVIGKIEEKENIGFQVDGIKY